MSSAPTVFGLVIDDHVRWISGPANVDLRNTSSEVIVGSFGAIAPNGNQLAPSLRRALTRLKKSQPEIFDNCVGIGVSSIGIVDPSQRRLINIALKNWMSPDQKFLIDFAVLFRGLFHDEIVDEKMVALNDASARCIAERRIGPPTTSLYYIMLSEGINCGIMRGVESIRGQLHPEVGHIFPAIHECDPGVSAQQTGCPIHRTCFEGLASGARIRRTWGKNAGLNFTLADLDDRHDAWKIIPNYVAQLCIIGTLMLAPERIIIAGPHSSDKLVEAVRKEFLKLNNRYVRYGSMNDLSGFISGPVISQNEDVLGALQVAQMAASSNRGDQPS